MKTKRIEYITDKALKNLEFGDKLIGKNGSSEEIFTFGGLNEDNECSFLEKTNNGSIDLILEYINPIGKMLDRKGVNIRKGKQRIYSPSMGCYKEKLNLINGVLK